MSGKSPGPGERGRTTAPKAPAAPGVTTRSRSRGHPRGPQASTTLGGSTIRPRGLLATLSSRADQYGSAIHPRGPQATPSEAPCGGVKRGPPRGSGSPPKRGPASPPPPSRGVSQSHTTHSGGQPATPSREVTQGLARCSIGQQGTASRRALFQDTGTQPGTTAKGVSHYSTTCPRIDPSMPSKKVSLVVNAP